MKKSVPTPSAADPPQGRQTARLPAVSRSLMAHAEQALAAVLAFDYPADAVLSRHFRAHREIGHRDRGFIAEAVYAILRRLRWVSRLAGVEPGPRELLLTWLLRGEGWQLRQFEGLVSPREVRWLEEVKARRDEPVSLADALDLPDWLASRLCADYGEARLQDLVAALNRPAPLDVRANLLKLDRDTLRTRLADSGVAATVCPLSPSGLRLADKPALQAHPLFLDGSFEVQDEGSQLLGYLVQARRGELVVDFCAGAGGKTLQLGALMRSTGRLYAFDVSERRLARFKPRLARAGLSNVHPVRIAHERDSKVRRLTGKADRVLVDAPCSGLGTLRRNPDLKWRQHPDTVAEMRLKQHAILAAAAGLVKPGGRLVYATCSLLAEENDGVVDAFLAAHPAFMPLSAEAVLAAQGIAVDCGPRLRLLPDVHDTDGFFAVVLERRLEPA